MIMIFINTSDHCYTVMGALVAFTSGNCFFSFISSYVH